MFSSSFHLKKEEFFKGSFVRLLSEEVLGIVCFVESHLAG
jgi:hypothetical protein